jgi:hypothetical protein
MYIMILPDKSQLFMEVLNIYAHIFISLRKTYHLSDKSYYNAESIFTIR